jgi:Bardet-Biedl syndrome 1 protein
LVTSLPVDAPVTCLRFGNYGREANTLLIATKAGSLFVKMLRRGANLENVGHSGPPPEQDVPLALPKKTKLYIEQTQRDRDHTVHMHRTFQAELTKMRLNAARAFVKITGAAGLGNGSGGGRSNFLSASNQSVRINARLMGFGPKFRIIIDAQNTGVKTMIQTPIMAMFNQEIYSIPSALQIIPLMIPGLLYHIVMDVNNIDQNGGADEICICLFDMNSHVPIIAAVVKMPICEIIQSGGGQKGGAP